MQDIIYNPDDVGKEILNSHGRIARVRKYHLTEEEMQIAKEKWLEEVNAHPDQHLMAELRHKAGDNFFNPYRQGIYFYQIQTLFLLGANEWHSLTDIIKKLEDYASGIKLRSSVVREKGFHTAWDKFRGKSCRYEARTSKDYIGRIQENFVMLQRLSKMNPYGYKLYQVKSALDIKRESLEGFENGIYSYRLSTYRDISKSFPIKDFQDFNFPYAEGKYISNKFIGTIITSDKVIADGKVTYNGK